ncbi:MAG: tetratricopeptide repeat protein [Bacteroidia bacterium]|nr:tetratricopeptide repeat protein [Bacteroidia bacterium]
MKIFFLLFLLTVTFFSAFAQKADILKNRAGCKSDTCLVTQFHLYYMNTRYANSDSAKWAMLEELALSRKTDYKKYILTAWTDAVDYYSNKQDYPQALLFCDSAFSLANELNNKMALCNLYNLSGIIYSDQSEYDKSIDIYNKELTIARSINFRSGISQSYANIGVSYYLMADYGKAIDFYLKSLKILEEDRDTSKLSTMLSNLAIFYQMKKQYDKSLDALNKALAYCSANDLKTKSDILNNIAVTYGHMKKQDKALEFFNKSIDIKYKINDKRGIALSYNNLCDVYSKHGQYDKAIENAKKALLIAEEANLPADLAQFHFAISVCYLNQKNYKLALASSQKSCEIARAQKIKKTVLDNYYLMADIYRSAGDYKKSTEYMFLFKELNDSVSAEEYERNTAEMEAKYQNQKKQKEIELLTKDKKLKDAEFKQQQTQRNALIAGLILVILLIVVVTRSYFLKRKDNRLLKQRNEEIMQQKEEIETQRDEIVQQNEMLHQQKEEIEAQRDEIGIQRDLVLSQKNHIEKIHLDLSQSIDYATKIQTSILPDLNVLKNYFDDYFVFFRPKDKVSGDFYWCTHIEGYTIVTVADCTGHGVPGAFMSMLGISFLREIVVKEYITNPSLILKKMRKEIIQALKQKGESGEHASTSVRQAQDESLSMKDGMDMALVSIHHETLEMQFAGANNPLYIVETGESPVSTIRELRPDKMPIAIYERMDPFTNHVTKLQKGDTIYLMSDGYEDQFGGPTPGGKKFKGKQLKEMLLVNSHLSMEKQKEIIVQTFDNWMGINEQVDDITLLGIKI